MLAEVEISESLQGALDSSFEFLPGVIVFWLVSLVMLTAAIGASEI